MGIKELLRGVLGHEKNKALVVEKQKAITDEKSKVKIIDKPKEKSLEKIKVNKKILKRNPSTTIYFNKGFGFLFTVDTRVKGSIMGTFIEPVEVVEIGLSAEELGEKIFELIEKSRVAKPIEVDKNNVNTFWKVTKQKSYKAFSRNFKSISISEDLEVGELKLSRWEYDIKYGGYTSLTPCDKDKFSISISKEELGQIVLDWCYEEEKPIEEDFSKSFKTFNKNKVSYIQSCDSLNDLDDGGSDLYQVYAHEEYHNNHISFCIDTVDTDYAKKSIEELWFKRIPEVLDFIYEEIKNKEYKVRVVCKSQKSEVVSYIFTASDEILEVYYNIDKIDTPVQVQNDMKREFEKIVHSIKIN